MPALATAGSGAWPPVSSTRWPRCNFPPWATVCGTNTASFVRRSRTAGSTNSPTTGSAGRIPGRSLALTRRWKSSWVAPSSSVAETCVPSSARRPRCLASPSTAPWSATAARRSTRFGSGPPQRRTISIFRDSAPAILSARRPRRSRPSRSRGYCIPMIPRAWGRDCASCRSISWWPARWPTWCGVSAATTPTGTRFPRKSPSSSTTPTRRWPSPS